MKNKRKTWITIATLAILAFTIVETTSAALITNGKKIPLYANITALPTKTNLKLKAVNIEVISSSIEEVTEDNSLAMSQEIPNEVERLRKQLPKTLEEAEATVYPLRNRFLMWTYDLKHIMWGNYRNNIFVGKDNQGKRVWGVYGNGFFAGLYDGEFFWGKYDNGYWKAQDLFGEDETWGQYVLSPTLIVAESVALEDSTLNLAQEELAIQRTNTVRETDSSTSSTIQLEAAEEVEKLKENIPITYEAAEAIITPTSNRFLMWTYDLKHIMWGNYRNNIFVGKDNQGKRVWGVYGNGFFAGLYDGEFFWGKYDNGYWKAQNLFKKPWTCGRFVVHSPETTDNNSP